MKQPTLLFLVFIFLSAKTFAQSDTTKPKLGMFFSDIHACFQHDVNQSAVPQTLFGINTAIIGYKNSISQKVTATILYDVTRTTNFVYPDSLGIESYFEGSKYTAFLKMAEIDWKIKPWAEFCFGQLLNEQYLTVQDKHWGFRYVNTTMQEYFRFGNPADFGARIKLSPLKRLTISLSAVNGEGPFRYQDNESLFQYSANLEYRPMDFFIFKIYGDFQPHSSTLTENRSTISSFAGFKKGKWMAGAEYDRVFNHYYVSGTDLSGISLFASMKTSDKTAMFVRADYMNKFGSVKNELYFITGAEYRPVPSLGFAVNIKRNTWLNTFIVGMNAGIRF